LEKYPLNKIAIEGIVLDYIGQSGATLPQIFEINPKIYHDLFAGANSHIGYEIIKCISNSVDDLTQLKMECQEMYSNIPQIIDKIESENQPPILTDNPSKYLGNKISCIVWQISDIHFGHLNKIENDPKELANLLAKIKGDYPAMFPDIIIISGDITSSGSELEYNKFKEFCELLNKKIWATKTKGKILVVPGNHDSTWLEDGSADRLLQFKRALSDACCITPFGPPNEDFDDGNISVKRMYDPDESSPPIAEIFFNKFNLRFLLLVSAFFSGKIPEDVISFLRDKSISDSNFFKLLRIDEGAIDREYLYKISNLDIRNELQTIAIIHHNPIQYGTEVCKNPLAPQMLETLAKKNIPLLFHGHTHLIDDPGRNRPIEESITYPIPCPTLCSVTSSGAGRGINIHFIGEGTNSRTIDTIVWTLSNSSSFNSDGIKLRYRFHTKNKIIALT